MIVRDVGLHENCLVSPNQSNEPYSIEPKMSGDFDFPWNPLLAREKDR